MKRAFDPESQIIRPLKSAIASKTIWGGVIAILPSLWNFTLENVPDLLETALPLIPQPYTQIVTAIGGVLAIFGRYNATAKISGVFKE